MTARRSKAAAAKKRPVRYGRDPEPPSDALRTALRAHRKGLLADAAAGYERALESTESVDAFVNLGAALAALGRARSASAALVRGAALAPDDARVQRDVGIALAAIGRHVEARASLERAVALAPALVGGSLFLIRLRAEAGDKQAAVDEAHRALEVTPSAASLHLELHRALFSDREPGAATSPAERAVALDPRWDLARLQCGGALALAGSTDRSREVLGGLSPRATGQLDAVRYALDRGLGTARFFSSSRETLLFALGEAREAGPVLEFGVRHGTSTRILAEHAGAEVHAFDSFHGLPEPWYGRAAGAFTTAGEVPDLPAGVEVHAGLFADTLPRYLVRRAEPPRLVHVDSDLYSSARDVLVALGPRMRPGTVLVFDEYIGNDRWQEDEHRAFQESVLGNGWAYRYLGFNWFSGQAVVRIE